MKWKEILEEFIDLLRERGNELPDNDRMKLILQALHLYFDKDFEWTNPETNEKEKKSTLLLMMDKNPIIGSFHEPIKKPTEVMYKALTQELMRIGFMQCINDTMKAIDKLIIEKAKQDN
jgi:hypothetical protein